MANMRKKDLKDIANQMVAVSLDGFDVSFNDTDISLEDKEYCLAIFQKEKTKFLKKLHDKIYGEMYDVNLLVRYGISKVSNELANDWEDGCENECEECGTIIYPYDTECSHCQTELDTSHLAQSDFYKEQD